MSRRSIAAVVVLALAAAVGGWHVFAQRLEDGIHAWVAQRRAEGYEVAYTDLSMSGFPLGWTAEIVAPRLSAPPGEPQWRWTGPDLRLDLSPVHPERARFDFRGRHRLELPPGAALLATAAEARADIGLDGNGRVDRIDARLARLELGLDGRALRLSVEIAELDASRVYVETADDPIVPAVTAIARTRWRRIVLPSDLAGPLGPEIAVLAIEAELKGTIPPGPPEAALAVWRDGGGTLEVRSLRLDWGPLALDADGSLGLDRDMQPVGTMTARVRGLAAAITAYERAGVLEPGPAAAARLLSAVATRPAADGGPPEVRLPITIRNQLVMLGPLVLVRFPRIRWTGAP